MRQAGNAIIPVEGNVEPKFAAVVDAFIANFERYQKRGLRSRSTIAASWLWRAGQWRGLDVVMGVENAWASFCQPNGVPSAEAEPVRSVLLGSAGRGHGRTRTSSSRSPMFRISVR